MCVVQYYRAAERDQVPVRWLSPESITRRIFNVQTDVYAYGITLVEILTQGALRSSVVLIRGPLSPPWGSA